MLKHFDFFFEPRSRHLAAFVPNEILDMLEIFLISHCCSDMFSQSGTDHDILASILISIAQLDVGSSASVFQK